MLVKSSQKGPHAVTVCVEVQALEAALPATTSEFMQLLAAHAAAGQQHSFATCQLLQLAANCVVTTCPLSHVLPMSETCLANLDHMLACDLRHNSTAFAEILYR